MFSFRDKIFGGKDAKQSKAYANDILERVGNLIQMPTDDTPTIATINDVTKLTGQEFFKYAKNGDVVIIYPNAKKAILYRPELNKIIDFSIVNLNSGGPGVSQSVSPTPAINTFPAASTSSPLTK